MKTLALFLLLPALSFATPVTRVIDGDTIVVGQTHVRLACIDAPESNQVYGPQATAAIEWIVGQDATLQVVNLDRYGRTVARVYVNGVDISLSQVKRGAAWDYRKYCRDTSIADAEASARLRGIGLWVLPHEEPWNFRKEEKEDAKHVQ